MARLYSSLIAIAVVLSFAAPAAHADHVDDLIVEASASPSPMRRLRAALMLAKIDDPRARTAREHLAVKAHRAPLRQARARTPSTPGLTPRAVAPSPSTPASCPTRGAGALSVDC